MSRALKWPLSSYCVIEQTQTKQLSASRHIDQMALSINVQKTSLLLQTSKTKRCFIHDYFNTNKINMLIQYCPSIAPQQDVHVYSPTLWCPKLKLIYTPYISFVATLIYLAFMLRAHSQTVSVEQLTHSLFTCHSIQSYN